MIVVEQSLFCFLAMVSLNSSGWIANMLMRYPSELTFLFAFELNVDGFRFCFFVNLNVNLAIDSLARFVVGKFSLNHDSPFLKKTSGIAEVGAHN